MIVHVAHYAGWPVAVSAARTLSEVWNEMDVAQS
jgi:alkylhydroperoxidase/carboxymuconolactone decarboxylase family protein YurZ